MNNIKHFLRYFLIGAICANIPFVGFGLVVGIMAVFFVSLIFTLFRDELLKITKYKRFLIRLLICYVVTYIHFEFKMDGLIFIIISIPITISQVILINKEENGHYLF